MSLGFLYEKVVVFLLGGVVVLNLGTLGWKMRFYRCFVLSSHFLDIYKVSSYQWHIRVITSYYKMLKVGWNNPRQTHWFSAIYRSYAFHPNSLRIPKKFIGVVSPHLKLDPCGPPICRQFLSTSHHLKRSQHRDTNADNSVLWRVLQQLAEDDWKSGKWLHSGKLT